LSIRALAKRHETSTALPFLNVFLNDAISQETPCPLRQRPSTNEDCGINRIIELALYFSKHSSQYIEMNTTSQSIHDISSDPRNAHILISINGEMFPRDQAKVSVFDSGYILGDGVWEGLRLINNGIPFLHAHIERIFEGAKAIFMDIGLTPQDLVKQIFDCLDANKMTGGAHIRLMITRGIKSTPYQDPRVTISPATIVIIPEYKQPKPDVMINGLSLHTVNVRRGYPDVQDQKINSHSKLNCITACIQATNAGADEALMLDPHGFVATCNSTHFFIVRRGEVWTSTGQYCIPGITRGNIIRLCRDLQIPVFEKPFSLYDVYGADEAFVTGTFAGTTPVRIIDGRPVRHPLSSEEWKGAGPITLKLSEAYKSLAKHEATRQLT
jgi:branched-chain amino acid aminotransferase